MKNNRIREFHYFLLTDYEKEETFLREKHNAGYKLVKVALPGFYYFEKCEPEDVVYRLDFNPQTSSERDSYLQMYKDYGWEYMQDLNEYSYFRKSARDLDAADTEIFSDNESRLDMLKRIFKKRMIPVMVVFLLCVWPQITHLFSYGEINVAGGVILGIDCLFFALYMYILIYCSIGFARLRKKYSEG